MNKYNGQGTQQHRNRSIASIHAAVSIAEAAARRAPAWQHGISSTAAWLQSSLCVGSLSVGLLVGLCSMRVVARYARLFVLGVYVWDCVRSVLMGLGPNKGRGSPVCVGSVSKLTLVGLRSKKVGRLGCIRKG